MRVVDYIEQHKDFALGNFIHLTPTIRKLSHKRGMRMPVYFNTDYVRDCFLDCPFIQIITEKGKLRLFGSDMTNQWNDKPDYQYIYEQIIGQPYNPMWRTYVDSPKSHISGKYLVVINGSGSEQSGYIASKDLGEDVYSGILNSIPKEIPVVAVGSLGDKARNPYLSRLSDYCFFGDVRQALSLINGAAMVVVNDSGLAHASGALNKPTIILWKDTMRERCKNNGDNSFYVYDNHISAANKILAKHLYE